ncbi:type II pantothenate kinase [Paenibacillus hamazuiensis]|uniref:type II pantothenate kinase n=1 Tax=Paenibacillus hamazuiensis TaxID=2936508 RepID=UPI00200DC9AB|nr:type II pantothenate kinase [Paenibacillus hamazuiensis]
MLSSNKIGVDAGGTLIKIAYMQDGVLQFEKVPAAEIAQAAKRLRDRFPDADICATGGKSALLQSHLQRPIRSMVEFDATCKGAKFLMERQGIFPDSFVLTNVGTGTSVHYVEKDRHLRVGGIGVGGGTLMGLSYLLTGIRDYEEIIRMSRLGNRKHIDLKVSDIYEGTEPPIPGDLTASNFGKALGLQTGREPEDMLASVIGLVGETITTISVQAAAQSGTSSIVYIGSSFIENDVLENTVANYTRLRGCEPTVLKDGHYSGALGALLS